MIKPIKNNIIFQFLNDTESNQGKFVETTKSGIQIISNHKDSSKSPRWALALYIGPDVKELKQNDYILIENLMWTESIKYQNMKYWKTDESKVMAVSKDKPTFYI